MIMPRPRFLLAACLAAALVGTPAAAAEKTVTVSGEATVSVPPDAAMIRVGVTTTGKTAHEASDANGKKMSAVLAAIKDAGVDDRDVKTARLSVQPQYDPSKNGAARLLGFQVTNQVTVRIRDIDKVATVLDRAIAAGANEMSGIEFVVSDQSKLTDQARTDAVADAHRKAEIYAQAAGAKLGHVETIIEEGASAPPRPMQAMRAAAVPIAPGEQTLRVAVSVTYALGP